MSDKTLRIIINRALVKYKRALATPDHIDPLSGRTANEIALHLCTSFPIQYTRLIQHGITTLRKGAKGENLE